MPLSAESALAIMFCSTAFAPIAVMARLYFRIGPKSQQHYWTLTAIIHEIFFILAATVGIIIINIELWLYIVEIRQRSLPDDELWPARDNLWITAFKVGYAEVLCWTLIMWSVKGAFMCLYIDMAKYLPTPIRYMIYTTVYVLVMSFVAVLITFATACRPISRNWSITDDLCTPQTIAFPVHVGSSLHLITDLMVLCIPVFIFRVVPIHHREKFAIKFIFCLGCATVSTGILCYVLRIQGLVDIVRAKNSGDVEDYVEEVRHHTENVRLASSAEAACGMFVLCLPSFRALMRKTNTDNDQSLTSGARRAGVDTVGSFQSSEMSIPEIVLNDAPVERSVGGRSSINFGRAADIEHGFDSSSSEQDLGVRTMYFDATPRQSRVIGNDILGSSKFHSTSELTAPSSTLSS